MKVYEVITNKILEALDRGTIPWRKPWKCGGAPKNFITGRPYRGVNIFLTIMQGYASPYWITFKQAMERGARVKQGEKGTPIIFWNGQTRQVPDEEGEIAAREIPFMRYYTVFNLAQIEGLTTPEHEKEARFASIPTCEEVISKMPSPPTIVHGFSQASYNWTKDQVRMPPRGAFQTEAGYYASLFHEIVHATGHASRLNRKGIGENHAFGSPEYSKEELIAECGASFLCGYAGIENMTIENQAAYIDHWKKVLSADKKMIITAAAQAQKAVDFIIIRNAEVEEVA
jgi:antirestriction protein ArdC